jgi:L-ascorbate metabolism protein UlaG (beta-lactamase superfamily)
MKKFVKYSLITILSLSVILFAAYKIVTGGTEFGGKMDEASYAVAKASPQFADDHFQNSPDLIPYGLKTNFKDRFGGQVRVPPGPFPMDKPTISDRVPAGIKAAWFGHATVYIEMDGKRILTDPMLSSHAFPVKFLAPERFNPPPVAAEELPPIDIVTISHDHFDHLDMNTVKLLASKGAHFFVGLGIKAHLQEWGISESQIVEMDWWDRVELDQFTIHCLPARHYSGRTGMNNSTLWASWLVESPHHKIYHSGDSGYGGHFEEIGDKFGSIDIGFIKIGDYGLDPGWRDIHMHTEQSVQAAKDINAQVMFPIHWGTFNLSNHDWFEPINLAVEFSERDNVALVTPRLGQTVTYGAHSEFPKWWKNLELLSLKEK